MAAGPTDQTAAAPSDQLENIIVTARRVEESQQSVPVALTALSSKDLEQQVVLNVNDLQSSTPGLFVAPNSQGGAPTFAIRGAKADNGTSPTVAVYVDEVPVYSTLSVANMVYDMQSITTLKGPQGTLFGANSTGGAIVFRPNKPTETFEGYAQAGVGDYGRKEFQGMVNVPVNSVLQLRFAGEVVRRDGFITNLTPNVNSDSSKLENDRHESARASARLKFSDTLVNDTTIDFFHFNEQPKEAYNLAYRSTYPYPTFLGLTVPVSYAGNGINLLPFFTTQTSSDPTWNMARLFGVSNRRAIFQVGSLLVCVVKKGSKLMPFPA